MKKTKKNVQSTFTKAKNPGSSSFTKSKDSGSSTFTKAKDSGSQSFTKAKKSGSSTFTKAKKSVGTVKKAKHDGMSSGYMPMSGEEDGQRSSRRTMIQSKKEKATPKKSQYTSKMKEEEVAVDNRMTQEDYASRDKNKLNK